MNVTIEEGDDADIYGFDGEPPMAVIENEFGDFEEAAPAANTMSQITTNVSPFVTNSSPPVTSSNFLPDNPTIQTFSSAEVSSVEKNSSRLVS